MTFPHPGPLPTKHPPKPGEVIQLRLDGLPSFKELNRSIRNPRHPRHEAFMRLREAAIEAMAGRGCYSGALRVELQLYAPRLERRLNDYAAGIEDTLDGSHGPNFTYLPSYIKTTVRSAIGVQSSSSRRRLSTPFALRSFPTMSLHCNRPKAPNLPMRSSEAGHRVLVATHASRGPGRYIVAPRRLNDD